MTSEPYRRAIGSLRAVALDAPDIDLLATFYEQLAGWRRVPDEDDDWITIDSGDGWRIGLQLATDHVPPHWPDQDRPQQAHLDFRVPDIDAAAESLLVSVSCKQYQMAVSNCQVTPQLSSQVVYNQ